MKEIVIENLRQEIFNQFIIKNEMQGEGVWLILWGFFGGAWVVPAMGTKTKLSVLTDNLNWIEC